MTYHGAQSPADIAENPATVISTGDAAFQRVLHGTKTCGERRFAVFNRIEGFIGLSTDAGRDDRKPERGFFCIGARFSLESHGDALYLPLAAMIWDRSFRYQRADTVLQRHIRT
jgi:hypothetical protein